MQSQLDHKNPERLRFKTAPGLTEATVRLISQKKNEPAWMLKIRLRGLALWNEKPLPTWGPDLSGLDLTNLIFYAEPGAQKTNNWDDLPDEIKETFERLGIPEAERNVLAGTGAQLESNVVYHKLREDLEKKGVIFLDMDEAVHKHPNLVKQYFMNRCVPIALHKFSALHAAVWSGGSFIYVPKNTKIELPLQAYFRMNAERGGQFEHTLIIVDEGAELHYVEGCSAVQYTTSALHAGCVEIYVKPNARMRYSSIENWSKNVYNLNTKRAIVERAGIMEWVNGNMGCLTGDTKVFTNLRGPIPISELRVGDSIYTLEEKTKRFVPSTVTNTIYSERKRVYKIKVAGRDLKASGNHPFLKMERDIIPHHLRKGRFRTRWTKLDHLKKGDIIAISKSLPDSGKPYRLPLISSKNRKTQSKNQYNKFEMKIDHLYSNLSYPPYTTNDLMWFFGIFVGDGNIWKPKRGGGKINIAIPETSDLRKQLILTIKKLFNYVVRYQKDRFIVINSNILIELLEKTGFRGTAKTKRLPTWVYSLPESQRLSLLAGLLDSDGHLEKGGMYLTSISKELLEDVRLLALSCGIGISRIFVHRKERNMKILNYIVHANNSYRILLNGKRVLLIPTKSATYKRKLKSLTTRRSFSSSHGLHFCSKCSDHLGFARIDEIIPLDIEPTYDIEVEGSHNFVANGILVHNSAVTMLYPASVLLGENARSDYLGIAFAGKGQHQDTGAKVFHRAPNTASVVKAKSISIDGGISTFRGQVAVAKGATDTKTSVSCDALILDEHSISNTVPTMQVNEQTASVVHEATVGKIAEEQLFYLMSRGLTEEQALKLIVQGFMEPVAKRLPLEYAIELNRLIDLEMENAIG